MSSTPTASRSAASPGPRSRITGASARTRASEALDRDVLLDRLHQLRAVLPVFAQELADVRRAAARLRVDNRRLLEEVHRLQKERDRGEAVRRTSAA